MTTADDETQAALEEVRAMAGALIDEARRLAAKGVPPIEVVARIN